MALSRYLAHSMVVFALASGCSQSLFDDGTGDDGKGPDEQMPDGNPGGPGDGSVPPDGSMVGRPDGGGPVDPDGGPGLPDAAVNRTCPSPCAGDAHAEFDGQQGGINNRWRYVEIQPDDAYSDMFYTSLSDSSYGWQGTGGEPPEIVYCNPGANDGRCSSLGGSLALTSKSPDGNHPALQWTVEEDGYYFVTAFWRGSPAASSIETLMKITIDTGPLQSTLYTQQFQLTTETYMAEEDVILFAGEAVVLSVRPVDSGSVTVGVELFISGPYLNAKGMVP